MIFFLYKNSINIDSQTLFELIYNIIFLHFTHTFNEKWKREKRKSKTLYLLQMTIKMTICQGFLVLILDTILESLQTECKKCTEIQKQMIVQMQEWYTKNRPEQWRAFLEKVNEDLKRKNANQ